MEFRFFSPFPWKRCDVQFVFHKLCFIIFSIWTLRIVSKNQAFSVSLLNAKLTGKNAARKACLKYFLVIGGKSPESINFDLKNRS